MTSRRSLLARAAAACLVATASFASLAAETALVQFGSTIKYLRNTIDSGIDSQWMAEAFNDTAWPSGQYGIGYESSPPGAINLIATPIASGTTSIYTRARFSVTDPNEFGSLLLGADYDDGYAAWLNGVEIFRSSQMSPTGPLVWNSPSAGHESSNGSSPNYGLMHDVSSALPLLHPGVNVLAVAVWNSPGPSSSDLVVVPKLAAGPPLKRGPYLQAATNTSIQVRWRTTVPTDTRLLYGTSPGSLTSSVTAAPLTTEHEVTLTGLTPGATYYYAVGDDTEIYVQDPTYRFTMPPLAGSMGPTRIWVLGDSGTASNTARNVAQAYFTFTGSIRTDLWLMLGDNAYELGSDDNYEAAVFDMYPEMLRTSVLWPSLGNHDVISSNAHTQQGPYFDMFTLPMGGESGGVPSGTETYYSFDHGDIHFVVLESTDLNRSAGGAMMTWLQEDAMATTKPWIIAFWHHPVYCKGPFDSDLDTRFIQMRENALPILEEAGVDLVLMGHAHVYGRSFLVNGHYGFANTLQPSMIIDGGNGRIGSGGAYRKPLNEPRSNQGAVYVVAGSSGGSGAVPISHPVIIESHPVPGSFVIDINGLQLDARFLTSTGAVLDSFTIYKGMEGPPVADIGVAPGGGPTSVAFTDLSTGPVSQRSWDFTNDGVSDSSAASLVHTYPAAGSYDVKLSVAGPSGSAQIIERVCVSAGSLTQPPPDPGSTLTVGPVPSQIQWTKPPGAVVSNVYRGTISSTGPFAYVHACLVGGVAGQTASDAQIPISGQAFYYIVSAENTCGEGSLGRDTAGAVRPNPNPCP